MEYSYQFFALKLAIPEKNQMEVEDMEFPGVFVFGLEIPKVSNINVWNFQLWSFVLTNFQG